MNNIIANLRRDRPLSWENRLEAADEIFRLREENARLREERDLLHAILINVSLSMEAFDVNAAIREGGVE